MAPTKTTKKAVRKTVKKTTAKKAATKKTATKTTKAKASAPARRVTGVKSAMTKTEMLTEIATATELSKKQVQSVLDELSVVIERHVKKKAIGQFTLPGLVKIIVQNKPATKARKGINPFTGEETVFKAKPARNIVKVRPLKKLKDMAV